MVWKNVGSALHGTGDIDAAAHRADWPQIVEEFRRWTRSHQVGPVIVCDHIPGGLNLVAAAPQFETFLEVGIKEERLWRGSKLFRVGELGPLIVDDPRGFRSVRPGAEGLFKLLLNGTAYGGRMNAEALRDKDVVPLLRSDPEGVAAAASLLGLARSALLRGARAAALGGWDRRAMLAVELWAMARNVRDLPMLVRRLNFKIRRKQSCPVVKAILIQGRRIPGDVDHWLAAVALGHEVYDEGHSFA